MTEDRDAPNRDPRYVELRRKFHPLLVEMDNRRARVHEMEMRNGRFHLRAEAWSADDVKYIWLEARAIDPDLVDLSLDLTAGKGHNGDERAADRDIEVTTEKPPDRTREYGDRRTPSNY
ncbi:MAG TPA: hypothetical protein VN428_18150 [Bryobacteraceae bacterium]|nr:hypothetical protein [Bryobacteraceae bacterium]